MLRHSVLETISIFEMADVINLATFSKYILKNSHLINIYNTYIQPYFNYCISLWGSSITSESDPLITLQNKILRILFSCKMSEDAWNYDENHKILKVKHLYLLEVAKLCYKHHTNANPDVINSIMPDKHSCNKMRQTRSTTSHNYINNYKSNKTLPQNCIRLWNKLPTSLKNIAYDDHTLLSTTTKHFAFKARKFIIENL